MPSDGNNSHGLQPCELKSYLLDYMYNYIQLTVYTNPVADISNKYFPSQTESICLFCVFHVTVEHEICICMIYCDLQIKTVQSQSINKNLIDKK